MTLHLVQLGVNPWTDKSLEFVVKRRQLSVQLFMPRFTSQLAIGQTAFLLMRSFQGMWRALSAYESSIRGCILKVRVLFGVLTAVGEKNQGRRLTRILKKLQLKSVFICEICVQYWLFMYSYRISSSRARLIAWVRLATPNLPKMLLTCFLTVLTAITNSSATA